MTRFSPSDLHRFLNCEHLARLTRHGDAHGSRTPNAELLAAKGLEHERAWLKRFAAEGRTIAEVGLGDTRSEVVISTEPASSPDWERAATRTADAMRVGTDVIYQGVFVDGNSRGISDFLVRIETPSALGGWSYEAWDAKLARHARPEFVLQLCFYSEHVGRIQGRTPEWMVVVPGTDELQRLRYVDFDAYYRIVRERFLRWAATNASTYPYPVAHCGVCEQHPSCDARWRADDHLSRIAGIRREQVLRLNLAGIRTIAGLAAMTTGGSIGIGSTAFDRLRHQASLQDEHRRTGRHRYDLLPLDERSGFRLLPRPSVGDIFFDIEGDPYFEPARGLEYLFGLLVADTLPPSRSTEFQPVLALTRTEEKVAFERVVDFIHARLRECPDLHVYHYAPYETLALKRLMSQHRTREAELDDLLRREVFVDLYQVVRQSLRVSHESYSLKRLRTFFMSGTGATGVTDGGDSILQFERWRHTADPTILDAIVRYNEEDCLSTLKLRDWLIERKAEAERRGAAMTVAWKRATEDRDSSERRQEDEDVSSRVQALLGIGAHRVGSLHQASFFDMSEPGREACALLADLLGYHRREAKPAWWAYFERRKKSMEDLLDETEAIAGLVPARDEAAQDLARSVVYPLDFPSQEYKLGAGSQVDDPFRGVSAGTILRIDGERGRLWLKRGVARRAEPLPSAVVAPRPLDTKEQRGALARVADAIIASVADGDDAEGVLPRPAGRYRAAVDILERHPPRIVASVQGGVHTLKLDEQKLRVASLDGSYLFIQGPPGSGKTYTGARLIISLLAQGKRVGVAAHSHQAINHLLAEVVAVAAQEQVVFRGLKKHSDENDAFDGPLIANTTINTDCLATDVTLVAGTSWLFSREEMDGTLDCLFIDEAGQVSLADAIAMATSATNVVVLGDPQQLPHVRQGIHPVIDHQSNPQATQPAPPPLTAGCSVLEHLLGDAATVPEDRGIFLARTFRMHPDICRFVSSLSYDSRLESAEDRGRVAVSSSGLCGTGLRYMPVEHDGNSQQSVEEAHVIAAEVDTLLRGGTFTDHHGRTRPLTPADVLVVAPFNMQVRCLRETLPAGVEAGTVDKFQGREAPVVFFSMASSSGDDVPRGLEFLFSRHRFNVAISRAKALAVVVCSPRLLEASCRTVEQMRMVNAICRFVEVAGEQT